LSQVIARAHVSQEDARLLKVGDLASLQPPDGGAPVPGKVTLVSPALYPSNTTVEVWVQAVNPKGALKAGSSASLSMVAHTVPDALIVPAEALVTEEGKKSVMVIGGDGVANKREVEIGVQTADSVQIVSGVKPGEQVVSTGAYGLPDKTKVRVEAPAAPGKEGGDEGKDKGEGGSEP